MKKLLPQTGQNNLPMTFDRTVSVKRAAQIFESVIGAPISRMTIKRRLEDGTLRGVRLNPHSKIYVYTDSLLEYIEQVKTTPVD